MLRTVASEGRARGLYLWSNDRRRASFAPHLGGVTRGASLRRGEITRCPSLARLTSSRLSHPRRGGGHYRREGCACQAFARATSSAP